MSKISNDDRGPFGNKTCAVFTSLDSWSQASKETIRSLLILITIFLQMFNFIATPVYCCPKPWNVGGMEIYSFFQETINILKYFKSKHFFFFFASSPTYHRLRPAPSKYEIRTRSDDHSKQYRNMSSLNALKKMMCVQNARIDVTRKKKIKN